MAKNLRVKAISAIGVTAGTVISAVGCGLVSIVLAAKPGESSSVILYDHASATTNEKKKLTSGGSFSTSTSCYAPSKPDAFSNGIYAVVAGTDAKVYIQIEP